MLYTRISQHEDPIDDRPPDTQAVPGQETGHQEGKGERSIQVETFVELQKWATDHLLPDTFNEMVPYQTYAVPMDWTAYLGVEAVILTCHQQVDWIGQCVEHPRRFTLHIDGKWKLHHGKWILVTVGTHSIEFDRNRKLIVHSFRPLLYMFTTNIETADSIVFLLNALNW